jgi:branched-chain amino acid transport system substrate-binding protein
LLTAFSFASDNIKIASIFSFTGEISTISREYYITVRFAVDEINKSGGILGKKIELIEFNNKSSALGSKIAAKQAVKENVVAVIGASRSSHALAMAPVLQKAKIPMITPIATNPKVTLIGDYIFRACFIDSFQSIMLAKYMYKELHIRNVAVLTNVDQIFSISLSNQFITSFRNLGGKITAKLDYVEDIEIYDELVKQLKNYKFDAVFLPGYTRDSALIIKKARLNGIDKSFFGGDGWSHLMFKYAGKYVNNSYYLTHWYRDLKYRKTIDFIKRITKIFPRNKVNSGVALTYDAVYLLADAITRAGTTDKLAIKNALASSDYLGVTGEIKFDKNRNPVKPAVILKLENNSLKLIKQIFP